MLRSRFVTGNRVSGFGLYFFLMYRNCDSHRFFILSHLIDVSLHRITRFSKGSTAMLDVILLALGLAFFVLSIGYAYACDRL